MNIHSIKYEKIIKSLLGQDYDYTSIILSETPYVSIQGEGPNTGKNTLFINFFGCNLANTCGVDWCDVPHSYYTNKELEKKIEKPNKILYKNVDELYEQVFELNNLSEYNNVVLTGGEPLLWQFPISQLLVKLRDVYKRVITVEIETNGEIGIDEELMDMFKMCHFNISPKTHVSESFILLNQLKNKGHVGEKTYNYKSFEHDDWIVKFVVDTKKKTISNIEECIKKYKIEKNKIYLMPEGKNREEQMAKIKDLAEYCINNGYNFSSRLQTMIWDAAHGV